MQLIYFVDISCMITRIIHRNISEGTEKLFKEYRACKNSSYSSEKIEQHNNIWPQSTLTIMRLICQEHTIIKNPQAVAMRSIWQADILTLPNSQPFKHTDLHQ